MLPCNIRATLAKIHGRYDVSEGRHESPDGSDTLSGVARRKPNGVRLGTAQSSTEHFTSFCVGSNGSRSTIEPESDPALH
jgi:hypothetical protein